jgi:hypothetical protein
VALDAVAGAKHRSEPAAGGLCVWRTPIATAPPMLRLHIGILDIGYQMKPLKQLECGTTMGVGSETLFNISALITIFTLSAGDVMFDTKV